MHSFVFATAQQQPPPQGITVNPTGDRSDRQPQRPTIPPRVGGSSRGGRGDSHARHLWHEFHPAVSIATRTTNI